MLSQVDCELLNQGNRDTEMEWREALPIGRVKPIVGSPSLDIFRHHLAFLPLGVGKAVVVGRFRQHRRVREMALQRRRSFSRGRLRLEERHRGERRAKTYIG